MLTRISLVKQLLEYEAHLLDELECVQTDLEIIQDMLQRAVHAHEPLLNVALDFAEWEDLEIEYVA
jgi:hypothetical protein